MAAVAVAAVVVVAVFAAAPATVDDQLESWILQVAPNWISLFLHDFLNSYCAHLQDFSDFLFATVKLKKEFMVYNYRRLAD